ncbi:hypothetical protein ANN_04413 [Periplaneta americana]|uniref:Uncharacterized protein n=1 Tax=Periplaneta americana TaxID=6978 RepID=A0ABQ8TAE9_PERAM|nr:hypothetical protein ANN_04413 [Periplaneta americana]
MRQRQAEVNRQRKKEAERETDRGRNRDRQRQKRTEVETETGRDRNGQSCKPLTAPVEGYFHVSFDTMPFGSLMLAVSEFQSLGRAIMKEDEYEEVRWDGMTVLFHDESVCSDYDGKKATGVAQSVKALACGLKLRSGAGSSPDGLVTWLGFFRVLVHPLPEYRPQFVGALTSGPAPKFLGVERIIRKCFSIRTHFILDVCRHLNAIFPGRWIGQGGPISWPPRSPGLYPLYFYLWRHLKSVVYSTPVNDVETVCLRIEQHCRTIRATPGAWEQVRTSMRRTVAYIQAGVGHFKQFL